MLSRIRKVLYIYIFGAKIESNIVSISKGVHVIRSDDSLAGSGVDTDRPHVIGGCEFLNQFSEVRLHKFVALSL